MAARGIEFSPPKRFRSRTQQSASHSGIFKLLNQSRSEWAHQASIDVLLTNFPKRVPGRVGQTVYSGVFRGMLSEVRAQLVRSKWMTCFQTEMVDGGTNFDRF